MPARVPTALSVPKLRHRLVHALFVLARGLLRWYPVTGRFGAATLFGRLAHRLDARHRRVALDNLARVYPELEPARRRELARRCFVSFSTALTDTLACHHLERDRLLARFDVEGWSNIEEADAAGRGTLLLTAHLGAWEAAGQLLALRGRPISFVARPIDNPLVDLEVRALRERFGNQSINKRGGGRQMIRTLQAGGRLAVLLDQRVHPHEGRAYDFLGHPAFTSPLVARLSLRTGAPVVPFFGIPGDDWKRYRVFFHTPIWPEGEGDEAIDRLTRRYLEVIEREIRSRPDLWLWMHRRWRGNPGRTSDRSSSRNPAEGPPAAAGQPVDTSEPPEPVEEPAAIH